MSTEHMLEVDGVSKRFRRGERHSHLRDFVPAMTRRLLGRAPAASPDDSWFWALKDVSFGVGQGEAFGIVGGNGAGKSTMLKLLTGIMRPTAGRIRVTGRVSALIEVGAGFHRDLTGRENVFLNGAILGMTRHEVRERFDAIVAFAGLEKFIDTPVKRYSSGMFARLGFSVAAHVDPDVLLVDEVLSVGDYMFQQKCIDRMNAVIAGGATVIFVSHNLREVTNLCKRSLLLEKGVVQMIGPTSEVIRTYFSRGQQPRTLGEEGGARMVRVTTHDADGAPRVDFASGGKMYVTVEAHAATRHEDVAVVLQLVDDHQYPIFDTCSERLSGGSLVMEGGDTLKVTFELNVLLAEGTFHFNVFLYRYVTNRAYDRWTSAATFFVTGAPDVKGLITLQPRLVACDVGPGEAAAGSERALSHAAGA